MKKFACVFVCLFLLQAQEKTHQKFEITRLLPHTAIKHQQNTGTCWSFAATSFFESELLRQGRGEFDLSEMFIVHHVYRKKAREYVRYHGKGNFGQGGLFFDWLSTAKQKGIVPESVYSGKTDEVRYHDHSEMTRLLKAMLDALIKGRKLTTRWQKAFDAVVAVYLGPLPEEFTYSDKIYTAQSFSEKVLQLEWDKYYEFTSYTHHPFYTQFVLEIPDNWSRHGHYYNLPIDELEDVADYALQNGYTIAYDSDVSEKTFYGKQGYAVIPTAKQKKGKPEIEEKITQKMRQLSFDNYSTTDDHLMHIIGTAVNQNGTKFYYVKNSWGKNGGRQGYWFFSRSFFRLKTISIIVHKDAIPPFINKKLKIK